MKNTTHIDLLIRRFHPRKCYVFILFLVFFQISACYLYCKTFYGAPPQPSVKLPNPIIDLHISLPVIQIATPTLAPVVPPISSPGRPPAPWPANEIPTVEPKKTSVKNDGDKIAIWISINDDISNGEEKTPDMAGKELAEYFLNKWPKNAKFELMFPSAYGTGRLYRKLAYIESSAVSLVSGALEHEINDASKTSNTGKDTAKRAEIASRTRVELKRWRAEMEEEIKEQSNWSVELAAEKVAASTAVYQFEMAHERFVKICLNIVELKRK